MRVNNVHERTLPAPPERVGALLNSLSSRDDRLWPNHLWPAMRFDKPLGVGAAGGHGPIRYFVDTFQPDARVQFRFTGPRGFDGFHGFEIIPGGAGRCVLRHILVMDTRGPALLTWPMAFRPLHDALIEDALALAQARLGLTPDIRPWPFWVRFLRGVLSSGKAKPQNIDVA